MTMTQAPDDSPAIVGLDAALAGVLRRSRLGIVVVAADAAVVWANDTALQMLPALDPQHASARLRDVVDVPAAGEAWGRLLDALAARRALPTFELPLRNGRWLAVEVQALPGNAADRGPAAALSLFDVTQRRRVRERERVEGELKRQAGQLGRVGAWEYDVASDKVHWTDEIFAIHGLEPVPEPDARTFLRLYDAVSRERWLAAFQAALGGQAIDVELDLVTPQGDARHVHAIGRALWQGGRVIRIAGVTHDNTAAHTARLAIAELRDRLRLSTQAIGAGVWEWHFDARRISWDDQMYRLYGMPPGSGLVDERTWARTIHADDFLRARDDTRAVIEGRFDHIDHQFRIVWPDGQVRHIQSVGSRIDTAHGRRLVGINFDVTDRERRAQALRDKEAAERHSRAKGDLLSRASHELRTPMNAVLGFAQLLQLREAELPPWAGESVRQLRSAGTHLLAMIDDLLDLAAVEAGSVPLRLDAVALDEVIDAVLDLMRPQADAAHVRLGRWARCTLTVRADATRLRQVLINLVGNAIKYNSTGGQVELLLEPPPAGATMVGVVVRDDGPGIAQQRQPQLFQPFNRLGAQTGEVPGHGLGLVISRQLAEAMGGALELRSTPGLGTEAVLCLPLAGPEPAGAVAASAAVVAAAAVATRPVRVLCVEDNPVNALLMREALALRGDEIELRLADSGERGLEVLASWRPDVVLLDLSLPGIDGYEVLRRLRTLPALAGLPCVAVSADAMPQQIARAREVGFDDYWVKPLDVPTLADRVLAYAPERLPGR